MFYMILFQTPPSPPGGGDTGIDELPIDHWIYVLLIIAIVMIITLMKKSKHNYPFIKK